MVIPITSPPQQLGTSVLRVSFLDRCRRYANFAVWTLRVSIRGKSMGEVLDGRFMARRFCELRVSSPFQSNRTNFTDSKLITLFSDTNSKEIIRKVESKRKSNSKWIIFIVYFLSLFTTDFQRDPLTLQTSSLTVLYQNVKS